MQPTNMAYDRAITVFSPDGRLFQVEYAREAVKRGTTTVGLKYKTGVVLIVDKRISSKLIEPGSIEKIFKIDKHVGCATSGLVADARSLIDRARIDAQINQITYSEPIQVKTLVKKICDFKQTYTQYGGVRPFGTALLIAGCDETGPRLFSTDPSGALMEYKESSEGAGRNGAMSFFESNYKNDLSKDEGVILALKALHQGTEEKLNPDAAEIGIVDKDFDFKILSREESKSYTQQAFGGK